MRLDKFTADCAALTRKEASKLIKAGLVSVNGAVIRDAAKHVDVSCTVTVNGQECNYNKYIYIMMNKPAGYVSATEDKKQNTVLDLIDPSYKRYNLFPVGRLDIDTEGFLLLTNDGALAHKIISPSKKVGKTYRVVFEKGISLEDISMLENGVDIGQCVTAPAKVERISEKEILLTITEGKFHQIKRMAHKIGNAVAYLKREAYGGLWLDKSLDKGQIKLLKNTDIDSIWN